MDALNRHLSFGHGFQQGRLCAWGGTIDFIDQQHITENWPRAELERAVMGMEYREAENIGREQVRSALHSLERELHRGGESFGQRGLANAWHIFQQDGAAGH